MPKGMMSSILSSPYLTYQETEGGQAWGAAEAKAAGLVDENDELRFPFPVFRFSMRSTTGEEMMGVVNASPGLMVYVVLFRSPKTGFHPNFYTCVMPPQNPFSDSIKYNIATFWDLEAVEDITLFVKYSGVSMQDQKLEADARALLSSNNFRGVDNSKRDVITRHLKRNVHDLERGINALKSITYQYENFFIPLSKETTVLDFSRSQSVATDLFINYYRAISTICYEYLAPHNFQAIVRPDTPGKSVEWMKAREHYTIIHRHHPANSAAVKAGSVVSSEGHLQRIAHSRRAHTRLLRSPKFRYKMGQRVSVKATWCGPKEWKDTAGQTYQILTPVI